MRLRAYMVMSTLIFAVPSFAADERTERVQFDPGTSGAKINDQIKGYQYVNYVLGASAGQEMWIELSTDNNSNYFNVFEPGKGPGDEALFVGSRDGNSFEGVLSSSGDYTIEVYLMRNAARRSEAAKFTLGVGIVGQSSASVNQDSDAGTMMADCRNRAAHVFHLRQTNVDTKYEGQRTDGTHAVNGTAYLRDGQETFQCSFNSAGTTIVQFVVN